MNMYEVKKNVTWFQNEMMDFQDFNVTEYFRSFQLHNITLDKAMPVSVVITTASFCVQGFGNVQVGRSIWNYTYDLNTASSPPLFPPHNVYFVCGSQAYVWCMLCFFPFAPYTSHRPVMTETTGYNAEVCTCPELERSLIRRR